MNTQEKYRITKLWIVIDEAQLEVAKDAAGKPAKFETKEEANQWAAEQLEVWQCFQVNFFHPWIGHNVEPVVKEIVEVH